MGSQWSENVIFQETFYFKSRNAVAVTNVFNTKKYAKDKHDYRGPGNFYNCCLRIRRLYEKSGFNYGLLDVTNLLCVDNGKSILL